MCRRIAALLCVIMLLCASASADMKWPSPGTAGQQALREYIGEVNFILSGHSHPTVNSLFECYTFGASLGITDWDDAEIPEDVELTFTLTGDGIETLTLRSTRVDSFPTLAGACIQAVSPNLITWEDAIADAGIYARKAAKNPSDSFADNVITLQGAQPRTYWAYYPNQYHDDRNWLQMTLVFPLPGSEESGVRATPAPVSPVL